MRNDNTGSGSKENIPDPTRSRSATLPVSISNFDDFIFKMSLVVLFSSPDQAVTDLRIFIHLAAT